MTRLTDILSSSGGGGDIFDAWNETAAAGEMGPLPAGEYVADIIAGDLETSRTKGTPGYRLTFSVVEPADLAGRRIWHSCWLTAAAMPQTKRDLGKLGVTELNQLERALPARFRCRVKLALRKEDDGNERNRVRSFEVIDVLLPERDPFAPDADPAADNTGSNEFDPICQKCRRPIDGCFGGCVACDAEAAPDDTTA